MSTSLQRALRAAYLLTMFGARGHYKDIGLGPARPERPVVTAMGGAGRSYGIHQAMLQHVHLGCVSPQRPGVACTSKPDKMRCMLAVHGCCGLYR